MVRLVSGLECARHHVREPPLRRHPIAFIPVDEHRRECPKAAEGANLVQAEPVTLPTQRAALTLTTEALFEQLQPRQQPTQPRGCGVIQHRDAAYRTRAILDNALKSDHSRIHSGIYQSGGVDPGAPWDTRASQQPLIKPYVRISRIRLPSTFTVQTLNQLGEAPPGDSTAPVRDGTEAHPGTRATMPAGDARVCGPTSARVAD